VPHLEWPRIQKDGFAVTLWTYSGQQTSSQLLSDCRKLVLAMVAAWRWDLRDEFPDGRQAGYALLSALREGPPWRALDVVMD
jgi:hypothetical protein